MKGIARKWTGRVFGATLAMVLAWSTANAQTDAAAASKAQFNKIVARLDTGGDLLIVANIEGVIEKAFSGLIELAKAGAATAPGSEEAAVFLGKLPAFLKDNGLYAVNGIGYSSVPRADGLHNIKFFLSRDDSAVGLPLWRGLVGMGQRELAGIHFAPPDAVLARTSNADVKQLWQLLQSAVDQLAPPSAAAEFKKGIDSLTPKLGTPLADIIGSLGDEGLFSVQLSRDTTIPLPAQGAGGPVNIPAPSLLMAVAVNDSTLPDLVDRKIKESFTQPGQPSPLTETLVGDTTVRTLLLPIPVPFPMQPSYAVHKNYLLVGSTSQVLIDAIKSFDGKSGLSATAEFKKAFEGLPMVNNGLTYVSPRLGKVVQDVQKEMLARSGQQNPAAAEMGRAMERLFGKEQPMTVASVVQNWKSGVVVQGIASTDGKELVAAGSMTSPATVGLLAAIAIPSFVKARSTSQQNACINNLRIIDSAKEQWAMANNKSNGDEAPAEGISEYMKGNTMPQCPAGGTYTIGAIGEDPTCNHPGHSLR